MSLNGGTIIPSYRSPFSAREVLRFISQPFRISQGLVIKESSFFSIASDSCTDRAAKKEELFYVRAVVDGVMATNFFSCQPLPSGTAPGIVTALKRAMAHADVDLDVWIRKLFFYCGDGASVVQGECGGIIRIIGDLQKEIAGYDVVVPYHASCHRCELAFKAAIASDHAFLDLLADTLQCVALFWNNAPSRLKTLHALALALDAAFLKLGDLHTRRWCAFAADALRRMKRCYVIVVLGLREVHLSKAVHKERRDALLFALTNEVFLCGLFFMLDVVQASALMSQGIQVTKRCSALIDRSVEACVAELDKVARWEGDEWLAFNAALVSHEGSRGHVMSCASQAPRRVNAWRQRTTLSMWTMTNKTRRRTRGTRVVKGRRGRRKRRVRGRGASASGRSTTAGLSGSGRGVSGHRTSKATAVGPAHINKYKDVPHVYVVLLFHVQGMDYRKG